MKVIGFLIEFTVGAAALLLGLLAFLKSGGAL